MRTKVVKDANGKPYVAYVGFTKSGFEVHMDKALADLTGDPQRQLDIEIAAHEEAERECA